MSRAAAYVAALALVATSVLACRTPVEPMYVCLLVAAPGYELNADSLEAEGFKVLPGDTLAVYEVDGPDEPCPFDEEDES